MAEVGLAHDGSLAMAHSFVDAVAGAGVDAVKFQMHLGQADQPWRVKPPAWSPDKTRLDYWKRTDFTPEGWWSLVLHAQRKGLEFMCSPFSLEAVQRLTPMVPAWKVPSGEIANAPLLKAMAKTGKPAILSTGMATETEIMAAVGYFDKVAVLQCTSMYPCPPDKLNLSHILPGWRDGLSDHSGSVYPSVASVALGAAIVEVHVILHRAQIGFDSSSSVTVDELKWMVAGIRTVEQAMRPVEKDAMARELQPMRDIFMGKHERKAAADGR